jgi:transposase
MREQHTKNNGVRGGNTPGLKHPNAAGIDLGARVHYVAVPEGRDEKSVRAFGTTTPELLQLCQWLKRCGVTTVAMESTGVYWIPLYELLEEHGIEVYLVNAKHLKNVPGRKTDVQDCKWLQELHSYGLLRASFRPSLEVCELRTYTRQRQELVRRSSAEIQHMQKALTLMNVRLETAISDVTGATGMAIIRDILSGNRDPATLARHRDRRCSATEKEIAAALTGNYRSEHVFVLRQAVETYDFLLGLIQACDQQIERVLGALAQRCPEPEAPIPKPRDKRKPRPSEPAFDTRTPLYRLTGCDLSQINGLGPHAILKIVAEIGPDVSAWPTEKHFTSWLRLAPGNNITGGKRRRSKKEPAANRVAQCLRVAAMSLGRTNTALGAFYRRLAARLGAVKATTATARKLAVMVYLMLKHGAKYVDPGAAAYEQRYSKRVLHYLQRRARALGHQLVPVDPAIQTAPATC